MSVSERWRVHFHHWRAGGRLGATWRDVSAPDEASAIQVAEREDRARWRAAGHSPLGHFGEARAELLSFNDAARAGDTARAA